MPDATEKDIEQIEKAISRADNISNMLANKKTLNEIVELITGDSNTMVLTDKLEIRYNCDCSKEKFENGLIALGKKELFSILNEDKQAEIKCQFCNKKYKFTEDELRNILRKM